MIVVLAILVLALTLVAVATLIKGNKRYSMVGYYIKGREAGFSFAEARLLKETARLAAVEDPTGIFWSAKDLERTIKTLAAKFRAANVDRDRQNVGLMDRLFEFRKRIEFEQPKYKYGIRSTRMINQNQRLRLLIHGIGIFDSTVIDNNARFLVCSYPIGVRIPSNFSWKGKHVSVYFWRQEDAGYVCDTYVIDDMRIRSMPIIHLAHTEALFRTQKRRSIRTRSHIAAYMYLQKRLEGAFEKPERIPGMKCVVQDLSEDGFSVLIGGKAKSGMLLKVQFFLGEDQCVMSGTARGIDYSQGRNQSLIHVECVKPSPRMRNLVRTYVYNLNAREEEVFDSPFEGSSPRSGH